MKWRFLLLLCGIFLFPLFAEPVFFVGVHGDVSFPALTGLDKIFGLGGGVNAELGMYVGNFSAGLLGGFSTVNDSGELVESMTEIKAGVEAGFTLDSTLLSFLPSWLGIRPNVALLADYYSSEGYRSKSKKNDWLKRNIGGHCPCRRAFAVC